MNAKMDLCKSSSIGETVANSNKVIDADRQIDAYANMCKFPDIGDTIAAANNTTADDQLNSNIYTYSKIKDLIEKAEKATEEAEKAKKAAKKAKKVAKEAKKAVKEAKKAFNKATEKSDNKDYKKKSAKKTSKRSRIKSFFTKLGDSICKAIEKIIVTAATKCLDSFFHKRSKSR